MTTVSRVESWFSLLLVMHPEFAPVAFLAAFLLAIPLKWQWKSKNIAILSIIAWLFVTDIIYAVDALVWAGNVDIRAPVWCDICELRSSDVHSPERF